MRPSILALVLIASVLSLRAQDATNAPPEPDASLLTLERIFNSGEFNGESFSGDWLDSGAAYTTFESPEDKSSPGGRDLVRHDAATGEKTILVRAADLVPPEESSPLSVSDHAWSKDMSKLLIFTNTKRVWRRHTRGDYWVLDRTSGELRRLGGDAPSSSLMFAKFSPSGLHVGFVRDNNIYVEDLRGGSITQVTHDGSQDIINGTFDWVYEEELFLRDGFRWSPDGTRIAYWQLDTTAVRAFPMVNNIDTLYPTVQWFKYPKAGEVNASCRVGVVSIDGGATRWMKVQGDPREHYIHYLEWPGDSASLVLQQFNRLQNTNKILLANPKTGKVSTLLTERDDAWIDQQTNIEWEAGPEPFLWLSERDGWRHAYAADKADGRLTRVTETEYDVIDVVHWNASKKSLLFTASPDNATQCYLYQARIGRGQPKRLTPEDQPGFHRYRVSPDGRFAIHSWSSFGHPGDTELISLPDHEVVRTLADNSKLREKIDALRKGPIEFLRVPIADGVELDAWRIHPPETGEGKVYPLLVHVYGEPAGQTVLDQWGGKGFLWHLMLAQQGRFVMSFDNRGTPAPRGRAWRKHVYRKVGILAPEDQAAAVRRTLEDEPRMDANRVGIWGWSGGGSMTLNALFKFPELYQTGIAIAAVPNQRFYDTIYQERYMGLPGDNAEGYREGSSIHFARQLKGNLLLIHGTADDNVHYQGAEALVNELVRHKKQFRFMCYPNRTHSISERAGTTFHLRQLMTEFLDEHLPAAKVEEP